MHFGFPGKDPIFERRSSSIDRARVSPSRQIPLLMDCQLEEPQEVGRSEIPARISILVHSLSAQYVLACPPIFVTYTGCVVVASDDD